MPRTIDVASLRVPVKADPSPMKKAFSGIMRDVKKFSQSMQTAARVATAAFKGAAVAAGALGSSFAALTVSSTLAAGRVSEMRNVLELLGQRAGWSSEQIDKNIETMKDLGIRTDVASKTLSIFARNQIDAAKASKLARVAQNLAVLTAADSSDTLAELTYAIRTQNTDLNAMREIGVRAGEAMATYRREMSLTKGEMTAAHRQQAVLNAIIEKGADIAGVYETAMEEPAKAMRSLRRHFFEARIAIGDHFLPVFATVVDTTTTVIKNIRKLLEEGEALHRIFAALSHIAQLFTNILTQLIPGLNDMRRAFWRVADVVEVVAVIIEEMLGNMEKNAIGTFRSMVTRFVRQMGQWAKKALVWGIKVSSQLAVGIIRGASSAIVAAMNFIGTILGDWLAPSSPPKIVPNIDKWGMETATIFLRSFSDADFGVLTRFQSQLQSAFQTLVDIGEIGKTKAAKLMRSMSADLTVAITRFEMTGRIPTDLFQRLAEAGGSLGVQLSNLARRHFELLRAQKALRQANERLTDAQDKQKQAQGELSDLIAEYTKMQRQGASEEALAAKREEIEAAKDGVRAAHDSVEAAKEEKKRAEEAIDPAKKKLALQAKLVDQLNTMGDLQKNVTDSLKEAMEDLKDAVKGKGGKVFPEAPELPPLPDLEPPGFDKVEIELTKAQKEIKKSLKEAFSPLKDVVEEFNKNVGKISDAWSGLKEDFEEFWESPGVQEVRKFLKKLFPDTTLEDIGALAGKVLAAAAAFAILSAIISALLNPILLLIIAVGALTAIWKEHGDEIKRIAKMVVVILMNEWLKGYTFIKEKIKQVGELFKMAVVILLDAWLKGYTAIKNFIKKIGMVFKMLGAIILFRLLQAGAAIKRWGSRLWTSVVSYWILLKRGTRNVWREILSLVSGTLLGLWGSIIRIVTRVKNWLLETWIGIKNTAVALWRGLKNLVAIIVQLFINSVKLKIRNLKIGLLLLWTQIKNKALSIWDTIKTKVQKKVDSFKEGITATFNAVKKAWDDSIGAVHDAAKSFWDWLQGHVFNFKVNVPQIPDWAKPGSPLPIHTAWKDFDRDMKRFDANLQATVGMSNAPVPAAAGAGVGGGVQIVNHFGPGSVRSDHDIYKLSEEIARATERRKLRRSIE